MVTDRASTTVLSISLAQTFPDYSLPIMASVALDIMSHYAHLSAYEFSLRVGLSMILALSRKEACRTKMSMKIPTSSFAFTTAIGSFSSCSVWQMRQCSYFPSSSRILLRPLCLLSTSNTRSGLLSSSAD